MVHDMAWDNVCVLDFDPFSTDGTVVPANGRDPRVLVLNPLVDADCVFCPNCDHELMPCSVTWQGRHNPRQRFRKILRSDNIELGIILRYRCRDCRRSINSLHPVFAEIVERKYGLCKSYNGRYLISRQLDSEFRALTSRCPGTVTQFQRFLEDKYTKQHRDLLPGANFWHRYFGREAPAETAVCSTTLRGFFCRRVLKMDFCYKPTRKIKGRPGRLTLVMLNEWRQVVKCVVTHSDGYDTVRRALLQLRRRHDEAGIITPALIYVDNHCCGGSAWRDTWKVWHNYPTVRLDVFHFMKRVCLRLTTGKHHAAYVTFSSAVSSAIFSTDEAGRRRVPAPDIIHQHLCATLEYFSHVREAGCIPILKPGWQEIFKELIEPHILRGCLSDPPGIDMFLPDGTTLRSTAQVESVNRLLNSWFPSSKYGLHTWQAILAQRLVYYNSRRGPGREDAVITGDDNYDSFGVEFLLDFQSRLVGVEFSLGDTYRLSDSVADTLRALYTGSESALDLFKEFYHLQPGTTEKFTVYQVAGWLQKERRHFTSRSGVHTAGARIEMCTSSLCDFPSTDPDSEKGPSPIVLTPRLTPPDLPPTVSEINSNSLAKSLASPPPTPADPPPSHEFSSQFIMKKRQRVGQDTTQLAKRRRAMERVAQERRLKWAVEGRIVVTVDVPEDVLGAIERQPELFPAGEEYPDRWPMALGEPVCRRCNYPARRPFHVDQYHGPRRTQGQRTCVMRLGER